MADQGFGLSISFQGGFFAEITSVSWSGVSRKAIDISNDASPNGWMEFLMSDLKDPGSLEIEFLYDASQTPPIDEPIEPIVVTFPSGNMLSADGGLTDWSGSFPMDDKLSGKATLKLSGEITIA